MKELIIDKLGDNQRLDKYLSKYLSAASKSFIYKMLRKKNITLNDKKADGSEKLQSGDSVKIFFSDETLNKFSEGKSCISNAVSRQTNNMTDKAADNTANEPMANIQTARLINIPTQLLKKVFLLIMKKYTDRLILCMKMRMSFLLISLLVCCHKRQIKMTALW